MTHRITREKHLRFETNRMRRMLRHKVLDLRFNQGQIGQSPTILDLSRASDDTFFDSAGILQTSGNGIIALPHDPVSGVSHGLQVPAGATNVCLQSEDLGTTWDSTDDTTVTTNQAVAPDGNTTADEVEHTDSSAELKQVVTITANTVYTISAHFKRKDQQWQRIVLGSTSLVDNFILWFDTLNGVMGSTSASGDAAITSSGFETLSNGWYRVWISGKINAADEAATILVTNQTADSSSTEATGVSGYFWGIGIEAGSFPTPYIKTTTVAASRAATVPTIPLASIPGWNDGGPGTFYIEASMPSAATGINNTVFSIQNGTSADDRYQLNATGSGNNRWSMRAGGVTQADISGSGEWTDGAIIKSAMAFNTNDTAFYTNGSLMGVDASLTLASGQTNIKLGVDQAGGAALSGTIARLVYWNTRLPNAELQALTI